MKSNTPFSDRSSGLFSLLNASSKTGSRISSRSSDLSQSGTYSFPSRSSGQFQQKKKKSVGIVHLSDDDDSDNGIIENDPVPSMISVFVACPESNVTFFEKAIMKQQRVGDIHIDLPADWDSQRAMAFASWATKLGIRKSMFGMRLKLVIPRGQIANLRRCIQAVSHISSDESSLQPSLMSSTNPSSSQEESTLSQSFLSANIKQFIEARSTELSQLSVPALKELCRKYGIRTGGRKQEMIDRILSTERAFHDGLQVKEERQIQSRILPLTPIKTPSIEEVHSTIIDDDESLLHQLRREEFQRARPNGDYYHNEQGQYNISLDDQTTYEATHSVFISPSINRTQLSFQVPPPSSRLSISHSEASFLGDLPRFSIHQKKLLRRRMSIAMTNEPRVSSVPSISHRTFTSHNQYLHRASFLHTILPYLSKNCIQTLSSISPFYQSLIELCCSVHAIDCPTCFYEGYVSLIDTPFSDKQFFDSFYSHGTVIGEGGYKVVLRCTANGREEAVSIMDLQDLREKDLVIVAKQEIQCAFILSLLVKHRIVPFFTEIFSIFNASYRPSFLSVIRESNEYLYTRMELANEGDLESFLRRNAPPFLPLFFQMVLSLYVANRCFGLIHYDVKLLNYLVHSSSSSSSVFYRLPWGCYAIRPFNHQQITVKLTDFGTAEMNISGPISVGQFTTFENVPPEYLLSGQSQRLPSADLWNLGLSLLHLLLKDLSYEVLMAECVPPPEFNALVKSFWNRSSRSNEFTVLQKVLEDDDQNTLATTLYRQLVLWFNPTFPAILPSSKLWARLYPILIGRGKSRMDKVIQESYEKDALVFSWYAGSHPGIQVARRRCREINGLEDVLLNLVQFDEKARMSYETLLQHSIFSPFMTMEQPHLEDSVYSIDVDKIRESFLRHF